MTYFFASLILLFCAPAVFVPGQRIALMFWIAGLAFSLGAAAVIWANVFAVKVLMEHPALVNTPLHPQMANLFGGVLLLFGLGLFIALGVRSLLLYLRVIAPR